MKISIKEINDAILQIFGDSKVLKVDTVYEKENDFYKLVIFFNKLYMDSDKVFYTKIIIPVDLDKTYLIKNSFTYLYDINCIYSESVDFNDVEDFKKKINNIFDNNKFGKDIKILSKFMEYPSTLVNDWLFHNNVTKFSVSNLRYTPKIDIIPCKDLKFNFKMNVNNSEIEMSIRKENKNVYIYEFKFPNNIYRIEKIDLKDLIETIGTTLKNNII